MLLGVVLKTLRREEWHIHGDIAIIPGKDIREGLHETCIGALAQGVKQCPLFCNCYSVYISKGRKALLADCNRTAKPFWAPRQVALFYIVVDYTRDLFSLGWQSGKVFLLLICRARRCREGKHDILWEIRQNWVCLTGSVPQGGTLEAGWNNRVEGPTNFSSFIAHSSSTRLWRGTGWVYPILAIFQTLGHAPSKTLCSCHGHESSHSRKTFQGSRTDWLPLF